MNREMLFFASLLILVIASTSMPTASATMMVGKIILNPTHAVPGTLVTFEGEGWDLPMTSELNCLIYGEPVKMDSHAICRLGGSKGMGEPVGTFIVKDVPAGTYVLVVHVEAWELTLEGMVEFVVDAATRIMTTTTAVTTTPAVSVTPLTSVVTTVATSTPIVPATVTVTTTNEPATTPQAFDYTTMLVPLSIAVILAVILSILVVILLRRTRSSQ